MSLINTVQIEKQSKLRAEEADFRALYAMTLYVSQELERLGSKAASASEGLRLVLESEIASLSEEERVPRQRVETGGNDNQLL